MVICKADDAGVERPIWNTVEPGILLTIRAIGILTQNEPITFCAIVNTVLPLPLK